MCDWLQVNKRRAKMRRQGKSASFNPRELADIPEDGASRSTTGSVHGSERAGQSTEPAVDAALAPVSGGTVA